MKTIDSKDQATAAALTTKYQEVATNMQSWVTKAKPDEVQKPADYMQNQGMSGVQPLQKLQAPFINNIV